MLLQIVIDNILTKNASTFKGDSALTARWLTSVDQAWELVAESR